MNLRERKNKGMVASSEGGTHSSQEKVSRVLPQSRGKRVKNQNDLSPKRIPEGTSAAARLPKKSEAKKCWNLRQAREGAQQKKDTGTRRPKWV